MAAAVMGVVWGEGEITHFHVINNLKQILSYATTLRINLVHPTYIRGGMELRHVDDRQQEMDSK